MKRPDVEKLLLEFMLRLRMNGKNTVLSLCTYALHLESKLEKAKEALEFYANEENWDGGHLDGDKNDFGDINIPVKDVAYPLENK